MYYELTRKQTINRFLGNSMANTAQARKRARQAVKLNAHNSSQRSALRTAIKSAQKAIAAGDKEVAASVFVKTVSTIDRLRIKSESTKQGCSSQKPSCSCPEGNVAAA